MKRLLLHLILATTCLFIVLSHGNLSCAAGDFEPVKDENAVIGVVLKQLWARSKYTVVEPDTKFCHLNMWDAKEVEQIRKLMVKNLSVDGIDLKPLINALIDINRTPVRLQLESTPEKGFIVDYKGEYRGYFLEAGGGWEAWYQDHPNADGSTEVSRPVYDEKTGVLMIYIGTQFHWKSGAGNVIVFKYESGIVLELSRVMVWKS